jgi:hypothetical protein
MHGMEIITHGIRERDKSTNAEHASYGIYIVSVRTFHFYAWSERTSKICLVLMQFHPKLSNFTNFELRPATYFSSMSRLWKHLSNHDWHQWGQASKI